MICFFCDVALPEHDEVKSATGEIYQAYKCPDCDTKYIPSACGEHTYVIPAGEPVEGAIWRMEQAYKKGMAKFTGSNEGKTRKPKPKFDPVYRLPE